LRVKRERETGGHSPFLNVAQLDFLVIGKSAVMKVERVNELFACTAAEKTRTIVGEFQTVEALRERGVRNGFTLFQIDNRNLVSAVAAVQHGNESTSGMNRDIDWEIAKFNLFAGRAQRPLIREKNGAVGLFARKA
jgi:hypothetical protein